MRPNLVVVLAPRLDHDLGFSPRPEPFEAQALVAELAVEAFAGAILPGLARVDQCRADPLVRDPAEQGLRDELRAVVRTQVQRCAAFGAPPRQVGRASCRERWGQYW